jgi:hypothetical protein
MIGSGFNNTAIYISFLTTMFNGVIDEFICNEYESTSPWMMDGMKVKYTSDKISNNLGSAMICFKINLARNIGINIHSLRKLFYSLIVAEMTNITREHAICLININLIYTFFL